MAKSKQKNIEEEPQKIEEAQEAKQPISANPQKFNRRQYRKNRDHRKYNYVRKEEAPSEAPTEPTDATLSVIESVDINKTAINIESDEASQQESAQNDGSKSRRTKKQNKHKKVNSDETASVNDAQKEKPTQKTSKSKLNIDSPQSAPKISQAENKPAEIKGKKDKITEKDPIESNEKVESAPIPKEPEGKDKSGKNKHKPKDNKKKKSADQEDTPAVRRNEQARQALKTQQGKVQRLFANFDEISENILLTAEQSEEPYFIKFYQVIERFFETELFLESGAGLVAAVSGGVDSVVMLDTLANLAKKKRFRIAIAHFNHNLRGEESYEDEKFVSNLAKMYNIPYFTASSKVADYAQKNSLSIEAAARQLRYRFFEKTARTIKANFVITAHTADDSAETFLINLLRGSGLTGLSGIPSKRRLIKDVSIVRPLISCKKKDLLEYAKMRSLEWREDSTNQQINFLRNRIRHELLPLLEKDFSPSVISLINRTSKLICGADDFVTSHIVNMLEYLIVDKSNDRFSVKLPLLLTHSEFIQGEALQYAISKHFQMPPLSMNIIDRVLDLHRSPVGAICELAPNIMAVRDREVLIIARKPSAMNISEAIKKTGVYEIGGYKLILSEVELKDVQFNSDPNIEYFDYDLLPKALYLRSWQAGDSFKPLGSSGSIKVGDFLTNNKISLLDRQNILVLATKQSIIWVCGMRISDKFKITKTTARAIKAEFEKK